MFAFYYIEDLPKEMTETVSVIAKIAGKSIRTLLCTISLLKLFSEEPELSATVAEILNISGKSIQTMHCVISLLKHSDEIRTAIRIPSGLVVFIKEMYP